MNTFNVRLSQLHAMALLGGDQDIRYYLNGVRIEFNYDNTRLVATDGHKLALLNTKAENQGVGSLTIPSDFIKQLPKSSAKYDPTIEISQDQNTPTKWIAAVSMSDTRSFFEIEGNYPDYSRVLHGIKTSGAPGLFNDEYLSQFKKAGLLLTKLSKKHFFPVIIHNGSQSAIIQLPTLLDQFVGVIMPIRDDTQQKDQSVDPSFYAPLIQKITVENNGLKIVNSEKLAT